MADDRVAVYLAEVREREQAATEGPWWSDQSEECYRLHGVMFRTPAGPGGFPPPQVMNKQIAKAPKQDTPYAEYWPGEADDAFITNARTDVPRLLAAVEKVLAIHYEEAGKCARCRGAWPCGEYLEISAALLGGAERG